MTVDEIKSTYSMRDVVEMYHLPVNRANFCSCPFHKGDRTASMKIYKDSYHCFGCNANGDIFTFVQNMDNCDFKTAFLTLGGNYEKRTKASNYAIYRARRAREKEAKAKEKLIEKIKFNRELMGIYVEWSKKLEPFSDAWCDCVNAREKTFWLDDYYHREMETRFGCK